MSASSGQLTGSISMAALSFIVHEPSGIIERSRAMSRLTRRRMYRTSSVSLRNAEKIGCDSTGVVRR